MTPVDRLARNRQVPGLLLGIAAAVLAFRSAAHPFEDPAALHMVASGLELAPSTAPLAMIFGAAVAQLSAVSLLLPRLLAGMLIGIGVWGLHVAVEAVTRRRWASILGVLLVVTQTGLWTAATTLGPGTLTFALLGSACGLLWRRGTRGSGLRDLRCVGLLLGLAVATQPWLIAAVPLYGAFVASRVRKRHRLRVTLAVLGLCGVGLSTYLALPVRSRAVAAQVASRLQLGETPRELRGFEVTTASTPSSLASVDEAVAVLLAETVLTSGTWLMAAITGALLLIGVVTATQIAGPRGLWGVGALALTYSSAALLAPALGVPASSLVAGVVVLGAAVIAPYTAMGMERLYFEGQRLESAGRWLIAPLLVIGILGNVVHNARVFVRGQSGVQMSLAANLLEPLPQGSILFVEDELRRDLLEVAQRLMNLRPDVEVVHRPAVITPRGYLKALVTTDEMLWPVDPQIAPTRLFRPDESQRIGFFRQVYLRNQERRPLFFDMPAGKASYGYLTPFVQLIPQGLTFELTPIDRIIGVDDPGRVVRSGLGRLDLAGKREQWRLLQGLGAFTATDLDTFAAYGEGLTMAGVYLSYRWRPEEGAQLIGDGIQHFPVTLGAWMHLGNALRDTGDLEGAERAFTQAHASAPTPQTAVELLQILRKLGKERSVEHLSTWFENRGLPVPSDPPADPLAAGKAALLDEQFDLAQGLLLQAALDQPDNPQPWFFAGQVLAQNGDLVRAIDAMDRARTLDPGEPAVPLSMSVILTDAGLDEQVRDVVLPLLDRYPDDADLRDAVLDRLEAAQDFDAALEIVLERLSDSPDDSDASFRAAQILIKQEKPEEAIPYLEHCINTSPESYDAYYNLAVLLNGVGRRDDAIGVLNRALARNPDREDILTLYEEISGGD